MNDNVRGLGFWFYREDWGLIVDALIEHERSARKRKKVNPDSNSDERADRCLELIAKINAGDI